MFTTHHNVQNGFVPDKNVSLEEFVSYHHYISAFIDTDKQFKTMMSGVWNMDLVETTTSNIGGVQALPGGVFPVMYGKNSREQWKYDMHRSMFGQLDQTPYKQQIQDVHANRRGTPKVPVTAEMLPAGVKTWIQVDKAPTVKSI
jgi:Ca2+-binding EF-hand superfamily protein